MQKTTNAPRRFGMRLIGGSLSLEGVGSFLVGRARMKTRNPKVTPFPKRCYFLEDPKLLRNLLKRPCSRISFRFVKR